MNRRTRIWLIAAVLLVVAGAALFAVAMGGSDWNFNRLSTAEYETNTYEIRESFRGINIDTTTADIVFAPSNDGKCRVQCYEDTKEKHSVSVQGEKLTIALVSEKAWYDYVGVNFETPKITVYLPGEMYDSLTIREDTGDVEVPEDFSFAQADISASTGDVRFAASVSDILKIRTSTGRIHVEGASAGTLELSASTGGMVISDVTCEGEIKLRVSTGKTALDHVTCGSLTSEGDTGDLVLANVMVAGTLTVTRSTGDVRFEASDAAEIFVETDTGDVTGTILSSKVFFAETDTGSVRVPKSTTGGKCQITTDTGDIKLDIS